MTLGLIAYIGPETFLPIASAIAAIIGVIIAFGRHPIQTTKMLFQYLFSKDEADEETIEETVNDEKVD